MSRSRYKFLESHHAHFLTCTIVGWIPVFEDKKAVQIVLGSLRFLQKENRIRLHAYVIMKDHLHLIVSSDDVQKEIRLFKSYTARQIIDHLEECGAEGILRKLREYKPTYKTESTHQLWQEGSHPEALIGNRMLEQKIEYIHYNPVRAGYVGSAEQWPYSSVANYEGLAGLLEIEFIQ